MVSLLLSSLCTGPLVTNVLLSVLKNGKTLTRAAKNGAGALLAAVQRLVFVNTAVTK